MTKTSRKKRFLPEGGADGRGDAVSLGVEIVSDLHRIARLALVVILVHRVSIPRWQHSPE